MKDYIFTLLQELLQTPSVAGYTDHAISLLERYLAELGLKGERTARGALKVILPGRKMDLVRVVAGHVDTLGGMVKEIKENGRLKISSIGGYMPNSIEGAYCTIETLSGKQYQGTVLFEKASVHVYEKPEEEKRKIEKMEIRIDEEVKTADDVRALGIAVGDYVFFHPGVELTESGFVKSRHLDDKAGVTCMMAALREITREGVDLPLKTIFFFTGAEEVGLGANHALPTGTTEFLAVDMGAIGQGQTSDEYSVSICAKDSSGPYDYQFRKRLIRLCEKHQIPYKVDIYPHYGSDASTALRSGVDAAAALIGPGVDASHAMERTHIKALQATTELIKAYLLSGPVKT